MPLDVQNPSATPAGRVGNRRTTIRYRCAPATAGSIIASDDQEFQRAWIDNLSRGGVGLFLSKPVAEGSVVVIQIKSNAGALHDLHGQIIHATLREPYGWYVGIQFLSPISDDLLDALL